MADGPITSWKTGVEVANSGKTMTFLEASELFRKYPKNPVFNHSNYQLFERIPAVPGTSNNRGLTVVISEGFDTGVNEGAIVPVLG